MKLLKTSLALMMIGISTWGQALTPLTPQNTNNPPLATKQVAGFYHIPLGSFQVTALYDGYVKLPTTIFKGEKPATLEKLLQSGYVDYKNGIQTSVNAYLVNTGSHLVLIDSGAAKCFGDALGSIEENIQAAGYRPDQIDTVLLTHLHPDHACGISPVEGEKAFKNATVYVNKLEADFWLNPANLQKYPEAKQATFKEAFAATARVLKPYQDSQQYKTYQAGDLIIDGIKIIPTYGHTVGHTSYLVESGQQQLLVLGDVVHNHSLQFQRPDINLDFDFDAKQAIQIRQQQFTEAAKTGRLVAGAHLPFPGIGHIRQLGKNRFEWLPVDYNPVLKPAQP